MYLGYFRCLFLYNFTYYMILAKIPFLNLIFYIKLELFAIFISIK